MKRYRKPVFITELDKKIQRYFQRLDNKYRMKEIFDNNKKLGLCVKCGKEAVILSSSIITSDGKIIESTQRKSDYCEYHYKKHQERYFKKYPKKLCSL